MTALAHNTARSGPDQNVPVIMEDDAGFPFGDGERADWHVASNEEIIAYEKYWRDKENAL